MKRVVKIIITLILAVSLSGCWNRRELNSLGIVVGIGIDKGDQEDTIRVTAQMVDAKKLSGASSGGGGSDKGSPTPYVNMSEVGNNIMTIFRSFTHSSSRKLYIPHNQVLIFGEEKARSGLRESLDFFLRDHESRLTVNMLVARGQAQDIFDYQPNFANIPSVDIAEILRAQSATSQTASATMMDFMQHLTSSGDCAIVVPLVELKEENDKKQIYVYGGAVFEKDTMVGELDLNQTRGYLWAKDQVKSGIERLEVKGQQVNMEIIRTSSAMKLKQQKDGTLVLKMQISVISNIASFTGPIDMSLLENSALLKEAMQQRITDELQDAKAAGDSMHADIFGLNTHLQRKDPKLWEELEPRWKEEVLPAITIQPEIQVTIGGLGRLIKPDYPKEELLQAEQSQS